MPKSLKVSRLHIMLNIMKLFKFFSFASNIRGRKSSGVEDDNGYNHWKAEGHTPFFDWKGKDFERIN